ncbi:MAG TPA: peptidoglycan-binding domain-containing protein [Trichocoleus sp.]
MTRYLWHRAVMAGMGLLTATGASGEVPYRTTDGGQLHAQLSSSDPGSRSVSASAPILRTGSSGPTVTLLQQQLAQLGHYADDIDGQYGAATAAAVAAFQEQQGIPSDGVAGASTWAALVDARQLQKPLNQVWVPAVVFPTFSPLTATLPPPPPSPLWILVMPLLPLVGGALTYLSRRARSQPPFSQPVKEPAKDLEPPRRSP